MTTSLVPPVLYALEVSGVPVSDWPKDVELRQAWGQHDLFFLRIMVGKLRPYKRLLTAWPDNAPIKITYGRGQGNTSVWYGYINHHELSSQDDSNIDTIQITYVCIGTSKPMNTEVHRAWPSTTPTIVAQTLARKYKLRCVVTSTNFKLPFEMQNESDFSFLNRIAAKVGFNFWVSGGTMYFIDPAVCLSGLSAKFVPQYRIDKIPIQKDNAKNFRRIKGDNLPGAIISSRQVYGVDQSTGRPFMAQADTSQSPDITSFNSVRHVTSYEQGKQIINAEQSLNQFWIFATVEVFGYTPLYPGKAINLQGYALPDGASGYWIVQNVQHVLAPSGTSDPTMDFYATRLSIMTNATGGIPKLKGVSQVNPEQVSCILVDHKTWQSSNFSVITDGIVIE